MLHVHYFGRIFAQRNSRDFCDKNKIILIEDCAHIIHPSVCDKWVGDYLFFSPHKYFPVKNSGVLYSKDKIQSNMQRDKLLFPYLWFIKNIIKRVLLSIKRYNDVSSCELIFSGEVVLPDYKIPSAKEIQLLQNITNNLDNIIELRNINLNKLKTLLINYDSWELLIDYNGNIPYIVGMNCFNSKVMIERYEILINNNCPVMSWPDLPNELKNNMDEYKKEINRTKNTIFFFIHHQLDMNRYIKDIKGVLDKLK